MSVAAAEGPRAVVLDERPVRIDFRSRGTSSAVVFVHGFLGRADTTWGEFPDFLIARQELSDWDIYGVGYSSSLRLDIAGIWAENASLETLGYYLRTAFGHAPFDAYRRLAVIAHSMGGLIAQQALIERRTRARVSHLFLFGTPSAGARRARFGRALHAQARDMAEGSSFINNLRAAWSAIQREETKLKVRVIAAERDVFVPPHSSLGPFPEANRFVVPGSHMSMVKPKDAADLVVQLVIAGLLDRDAAFALRHWSTDSPTFLLSDIEESTRRWERYPQAMTGAVRRQEGAIRNAIAKNGGETIKTVGDAVFGVFDRPERAVAAAIDAQRRLGSEDFSAVDGLHVRMAVHRGTAEERDGDFYGLAVNRIRRILPIGHGGQILVSGVTAELARPLLPADFTLRNLGMHRLRDLADPEELYQASVPGLRQEFPPLRSLDTKPNNLPAESNAFIGRETELRDVRALIQDHRFVSLVGAGGVGKTRLSLHVAVDLLDAFPDGIWFVELGTLSDPSLIWNSAAAAMGLSDPGDRVAEKVVAHIKDRSMLLIFDNCEHVIDRAAEVVTELLRQCAKVHIVCTSREPLHGPAERVYRMPSLPTVDELGSLDVNAAMAFGSISLFVERSQAAQPQFRLTEENVTIVAEICRRLDGVALAIELAAAWIGSVPLPALAQHVEHRMLALTRGSRGTSARQQTMRSVIDWSYSLLSELERRVFADLSIFVGGFTLDAGIWLCTHAEQGLDEFASLEVLTALTDKSLVIMEMRSDQPRYRLLEPLREFGREKLISTAGLDRLAGLHAAYYRNLIESVDRSYWRCDGVVDPFVELGNLRASLQWALAEGHDVVTGAATAGALLGFWFVAGDEGRRWVDLARAQLPPGEPAIEARLNLGLVQLEVGAPAEMRSAAEAAVAYYRASSNLLKLTEALYHASMTLALYFPQERAAADALATEALDVAKRIDAPGLLTLALRAKAVTMDAPDDTGRLALLEEALELARVHGANPRLMTAILMQMSELEFGKNHYNAAIDYGLEALRDSELAGYSRALTFVRANLAHYAVMANDVERARAWAEEALKAALEAHDAYSVTVALNALAAIEGVIGNSATAAELLGFCNARFGHLHPPRQDRSCEEIVYQFVRTRVVEVLGADQVSALLHRGESISLEQALRSIEARSSSHRGLPYKRNA
jgi:predicted ATPase/class 3 adenylate cyclase